MVKVHRRQHRKQLNLQVNETNSRKVRLGLCPLSYPARGSEPSLRGQPCTETRALGQSAVPGAQRFLSISGSLSTLQTSSPRHIRVRKVPLMAPFYFKGVPEWMVWLRSNPHSSNSWCPGSSHPPSPHQYAIWVQCRDIHQPNT